jgi:serine/threonine-protein kinase
MDSIIGRTIKGRFRVLQKIGEGAMGAVYLAEQITIGRSVALKMIHRDFARDEDFVARFRDEARAAASVRHAAVMVVHDYDQAEDGSLFIAMELLEGRTLGDLLRQDGAMDVGRAVRIATQVAEGLEAAHRAGVIHRDVKPHNIMVGADDHVKLMDFGIARLRDRDTAGLTRAGLIIGTPEYMAPEQIEGGEITERTDIYALGVVLYEMLTGAVPFRGATASVVLTRHLSEAPRPLDHVRAGLPAELVSIIAQALAKDPGRRQRDMGEVVKALRRLTGYAPPGSRDDGPETLVGAPATVLVGAETRAMSQPAVTAAPERGPISSRAGATRVAGRRWLVGAIAALLLVSAGIGLALMYWSSASPDPQRVRAGVQARLREEGLTGVTAVVTAQGVVTLVGAVSAREEADKAVRVARGAPDVKQVVTRIEVREPPPPPPARPPARTGDIRQGVEERLRREDLLKRTPSDRLGLTVEVSDEAVVTLVGALATPAAVARAVQMAGAVSDVKQVVQRIEVLDLGRIKATVEARLRTAGFPELRAEVGRNLAVTLTGVVGGRAQEAEALRVARGVEDVTGAVSRLTVRTPEPPSGNVQQAVQERLRSGGYLDELVVEVSGDRTVTLTGVVENPAEKEKALALARGVPGVRGVQDKINVRCQWAGTC